jgi:hypothetical protein
MALQGQRYPYLFTSEEEMERLLSEDGALLHTDDVSDNEEMLYEIIERATGRVKQVLNKSFDDVNLAQSPRVREIATIIGCYLLSIRRGNPSLYQEQYIEAMSDLEQIADGELYLSELPRSGNTVAVFQNVSSDNRFPFSPIRVDAITSTRSVGGQFLNRMIPFLWL